MLPQIETSNEEEDYILKNQQNVAPDVPSKVNDIMRNSEVEDSDEEEENTLTNKGTDVKIHKYNPIENVTRNINEGIITKSKDVIANMCCIFKVEPKNVKEALTEEYWINSIYEELALFERNKVWELVPIPNSTNIIGTKCISKNKSDERVTYLTINGSCRGGINKILFFKKEEGKSMITQIYVDNILFGGISNKMVEQFIQQM